MFEAYKNAFKTSATLSSWDDSTMYLYIGMVIITILIGQVLKKSSNSKLLWGVLILILSIPCCFRDTGDDTIVYRYYYNNANASYDPELELLEPLYLAINRVLSTIISSDVWGIVIITGACFFCIFSFIYQNRRRIDVALSLMAFVCLYYFPIYNILRIYLASSIVLYCFKYFENKEFKKFSIVVMICGFIHYSTFSFFIPLIGYVLYKRNPRMFVIGVLSGIILVFVALNVFMDYVMLLNRYATSLAGNETQSLGLAQIVYHLILFAVLYAIRKARAWDNTSDVLFVFSICSFLFAMLSYQVPIAGRLSVHMMVIYLYLVPNQLLKIKATHFKYYHHIKILYIMLLLFKLHLYFLTGLASDVIMPYKSIL